MNKPLACNLHFMVPFKYFGMLFFFVASQNNMVSSDANQLRTTCCNEVKDRLTIRSFQRSDQKQCVQIFVDGFQDFVKHLAVVTFWSKLSRYIGLAAVFTLLAAVLWSTWIFVVFVFIILILLTVFCIYACVASYKFINYCKKTDMKDIKKWYMSDEGNHMWVAELCGQVVGMVALRHHENHEPGVFKLQRMYVVPRYQRMGIGKRMLTEVITHAKKHRMKMIILTTSKYQVPAIQLYMKCGFKVATRSSSGLLYDVINFKLEISSP